MQYLNNMRALAILMIILAHAMLAHGHAGGAAPFVDYLVGNGTMVFVYIAGFLFVKTTAGFRYLPYLRNKALTVVLPYLVTSLPITMAFVLGFATRHRWLDMDWFLSLGPVERFFVVTATGAQLGPLWFVPMIVLFYLASPAFVRLSSLRLLVPAFLTSLIVACLVGRAAHNANPLQNFVYYLPCFVLGLTMCRAEPLWRRWLPWAVPALLVAFAAYVGLYGVVFSAARPPTPPEILPLTLPLIVLTTLVAAGKFNERIPVLDMLARLSFYIYFVHGYFSGLARIVLRAVLGPDIAFANPVADLAAIATVAALTLLSSLGLFVALKLLLGDRSRFLIGA